jgi:hypothetical protein
MNHYKNQKEMFLYIWETRAADNGYKSELTGLPLFPPHHYKWHWQFLHVLPKGTYPKYKLNPDNILLGTIKEHENQERYEVFQEKQLELKRAYYKEYYNKEYDE